MGAKNYPPTAPSAINSVTDANPTYTPDGHHLHDLGMAMDLGTHDWINDANQLRQAEQHIPAISTPALPANQPTWSVDRAFAPPGIQAIKTSANLLADKPAHAAPQKLPAEEAAQMHDVLLALKLPKADKVEKMCRIYEASWEAPNTNTVIPSIHAVYAMGGWSPRRGETEDQWSKRLDRDWDVTKVTLVEPPMHGRFVEGESGINAKGDHLYRYVAPSKDFNGQDRASFLVEFKNGKRLLLRYQFNPGEPEDMSNPKICKTNLLSYQSVPMPQGSGNEGGIETWQTQSQLSALLAAASGAYTKRTDLPGSAVGNTTGSGLYAQITLDTNAAGHGWYVDATPLDNSDDFLPTSDAII